MDTSRKIRCHRLAQSSVNEDESQGESNGATTEVDVDYSYKSEKVVSRFQDEVD